jgi:membrane protease YdiL (CAAX protease family)
VSGVPSPRRAAGTFGLCLAGLVLVFLACSGFNPPPPITVVSALSSLFAVLIPTLIAFYWPRAGAPGLPPYKMVSSWTLAAIACCSLPVYTVMALFQVAIGTHMRVHGPGDAGALVVTGVGSLVGTWIAIALLPALAEELLFRGMVQQAAVARLGVRWGILATAFTFSFIHGEAAGFLPRLIMGIWFGLVFWRTGSLVSSTWAHALNNTWVLVVANNATLLDAHLGWVALASVIALGLGWACYQQSLREPPPPESDEPAMPRVITMRRPPEPNQEGPR